MKVAMHSAMAVGAAAALLWTGTVPAQPAPQESCDQARMKAWQTYLSCVDTAIAKVYGGVIGVDITFSPFAKCRHKYFKKWTAFQAKASLASSTCIGTRFTDNGDQTVTDHLSGLVWEKKDNLDGTSNSVDPHDADNLYTWSTGTNKEDGTAFTSFLAGAGTGLNTAGFAGANGWRLPTVAELQTIELDFMCTGTGGGPTCRCGSNPCIDGAFGPTQSGPYWSATGYVSDPAVAWGVSFFSGPVGALYEKDFLYVRAVRGGL